MVHRLPELLPEQVATCRRCKTVLHARHGGRLANQRARNFALAALILFPAAVHLPVMHLSRFGHTREASVWSGSRALLEDGQWFVGAVVVACSLVVPLLKLSGILALTGPKGFLSRRNRALTYRVIELAGRFGMLDVLLVALVVAWVKVGDVVEIRAGPGVLAFTTCVLLSLLASTCFDPHALWLRTEPDSNPQPRPIGLGQDAMRARGERA